MGVNRLRLVLVFCQIAYTTSLAATSQLQPLFTPLDKLKKDSRNLQMSLSIEPSSASLTTPCLTTITAVPVLTLGITASPTPTPISSISPFEQTSISIPCSKDVNSVFPLRLSGRALNVYPNLKAFPEARITDIEKNITPAPIKASVAQVETGSRYKVLNTSVLLPSISNSEIDAVDISPCNSLASKYIQNVITNNVETVPTTPKSIFLENRCPVVNKSIGFDKPIVQSSVPNKIVDNVLSVPNNDIVTLPLRILPSGMILEDHSALRPVQELLHAYHPARQETSINTPPVTQSNDFLRPLMPLISKSFTSDFISPSTNIAKVSVCPNPDSNTQSNPDSKNPSIPTISISPDNVKLHQNSLQVAKVTPSHDTTVPNSKPQMRSSLIPALSFNIDQLTATDIIENTSNCFSPIHPLNSEQLLIPKSNCIVSTLDLDSSWLSSQHSSSNIPTYLSHNSYLTPKTLPHPSLKPSTLLTESLFINSNHANNLENDVTCNHNLSSEIETTTGCFINKFSSSQSKKMVAKPITSRSFSSSNNFIPCFNLTRPLIKSPTFLPKPAIHKLHTGLSLEREKSSLIPSTEKPLIDNLTKSIASNVGAVPNIISITINIIPHLEESSSEIIIII